MRDGVHYVTVLFENVLRRRIKWQTHLSTCILANLIYERINHIVILD